MKVNIELLKKLYLIEHPSREEHKMISFVINYCKWIEGVTFELDHYNNLFVTKNTTNPVIYPCIVAHMDEVQHYKFPKEVIVKNDMIFARYIGNKQQCGLGADDANGIYVALHLLKILPNLKVCFTVEEEIGGFGAFEASYNLEFFSNCQYLLQADRRGKSDLIVNTNGITIVSDLFYDHLVDVAEKFNYSPEFGTFTDVGVLCEELELSGLNISCGYYNEHTPKECTNIKELENCLNFIYNIIITLNDAVYPLEIPDSIIDTHYDMYMEDDAYLAELEKKYLTYDVGKEIDDYGQKCAQCSHFDCQRCDYY